MIDLRLKYTTRADAYEVSNLTHCPGNSEANRILGFIKVGDKLRSCDWYESGAYNRSKESYNDLVLAPVEITRWFNIYESISIAGSYHSGLGSYKSREEADKNASMNRVSCIEHTFTVPQE